MFASSAKEKACILALHALATHLNAVATDTQMSIDARMKTLQWIYKKIPEVNKLLIAIKTEQINGR